MLSITRTRMKMAVVALFLTASCGSQEVGQLPATEPAKPIHRPSNARMSISAALDTDMISANAAVGAQVEFLVMSHDCFLGDD